MRFARRIASCDASLRLYGILDSEICAKRGIDLLTVAEAWREAGVGLVQYRDKISPREVVASRAHALREIFPAGERTFLLLNDFCDLAIRCEFDGVHVGQTDMAVREARNILGPEGLIGVSTHTPDQAVEAERTGCDYVAIGPVFPTQSKADAAAAVGLCGVQAARALVRKPLVAIGGIGLNEARTVLQAGADAVAVISGLLGPTGMSLETAPQDVVSAALTKHAQDFLLRLK